jgi:hypothetical protein
MMQERRCRLRERQAKEREDGQDHLKEEGQQQVQELKHQAVQLATGKAKVCHSDDHEAFSYRQQKREEFTRDYEHWLEKKLEVQVSLGLQMDILQIKQHTIEMMSEGVPSNHLGDGRDGDADVIDALDNQLIQYASRLAELAHEKAMVEAEMEARACFHKECCDVWA